MKKIILLYLFFLYSLIATAQKEGNFWFFGYNACVSFANPNNPASLPGGELVNLEGCTSISNSAGQLLFYSNGIVVWNRANQIMPNGLGLLGNDSTTQSAISVPIPGSPNLFYLFTLAQLGEPDGLNYSIIDMGLQGGYGDVTTTKNVQLYTPAAEKMTAIKNAAGDGYWLIIHGLGSNSFIAYSITAAGINPTPVVSNVGTVIDMPNGAGYAGIGGYLKISPNARRIISCNAYLNVELFDFDNATGIITNPRIIDTRTFSYGAEFSPSGNVAYITTGMNGIKKLFQYDLTASDIVSTEYLVAEELLDGGSNAFAALQLGPNGKIYLTANFRNYISAINDPEILGPACNFQLGAINISPNTAQSGLPQFIQSYFDTDIVARNICLGTPTQFSYTTPYTINGILWNFGDTTTSTSINPNHQYANPGTYNVTATAMTTNGLATKTKQVKISSIPVFANSINNQNFCGSATMSFDLAQFDNAILGSQSSLTYGIAYFSNLSDATNHRNELLTLQNLLPGANTYYAKIFNKENKNCNTINSFAITLVQKPIANPTTDYVICENLPYDNIEQFDLSTINAQVLNGQNPIDFTVSYHDSQYDADNNLNALPLIYQNTLPTETIFIRVQNNLDITCFATTTLNIRVIHQPTIIPITDFNVCDDSSNDGIETFDLQQKTIEILNGQSASLFEVKYYRLLQDAQSDSNEITLPINNSTSNQVYYSIQAIGNPLCKVISSFRLVVSQKPQAFTTNPIFICDDNTNNGIGIFDLRSNDTLILGTQDSSQFNITYHASQIDANLPTSNNPLPINYQNTSNPQTIFARIENTQNPNCFATTSFQIGLHKMPVAFQALNLFSCDDQLNDEIETFNLGSQTNMVIGTQSLSDFNVIYYASSTEASSRVNPLPESYSNTSNPQTIYARVENKNAEECYAISSFDLSVKEKPVLTMKDIYSLCEGNSVTINAPQGFTSYNWSNGSLSPTTTIYQADNYTLKVTQDYGDITCETIKNINVVNSNIATITKIITEDFTDNDNMINVIVTGDGKYEYSLDGINYQDSAQFYNVRSGQHTVYVRDQNGCGIATQEVFLMMFPRFFTPNGDGFNDFWKIKFSDEEPAMRLFIVDRYGKPIIEFNGTDVGWDGNSNGYQLPSDDYWFIIKRQNGKELKGHFTLKR